MPPKRSFESKAVGNKNLERIAVPKFSVDITGYWDTVSRNEAFVEKIKTLPFYKSDLLYCGFVCGEPMTEGKIFCGDENDLMESELANPLDYAQAPGENKIPQIAVYEPLKMKQDAFAYRYTITEKTALIAIIKIIDKT